MNDTTSSVLAPLFLFKEQFSYVPHIVRKEKLASYSQVIICGMGGSAISVSLLKMMFPELPISLHNTYGLPHISDKKKTLCILNSYSGDTEEVLDTLKKALKEGIHVALLSKGGALIHKGIHESLPYIMLPESDLEPRFSIGYQMLGLLSLMKEQGKISILRKQANLLDLEKSEKLGKDLSEKFKGLFPVIYSSTLMYPVAYLIKAAINEGAKIPCFVNQIPESNHNELQSYITNSRVDTHSTFGFLYLPSIHDHIRILKRFTVMESLHKKRRFVVEIRGTDHTNIVSIFEMVLTGYYLATYLAINRNVDPYKTPFIQEFKKKMKE